MFGQELLIQVLLCNYLSHAYRWESEGSGGGGGGDDRSVQFNFPLPDIIF